MKHRSSDSIDPIAPYTQLMDICTRRKPAYWVLLDWGREGWSLTVVEPPDDVLARATSTRPVPKCFSEMAANCLAGLSRKGKAR